LCVALLSEYFVFYIVPNTLRDKIIFNIIMLCVWGLEHLPSKHQDMVLSRDKEH